MRKSKEYKYSFEEYVDDIELYQKTSPFENTYQRVIENVLKNIIKDSEVELIISDKFRRNNTQTHCVEIYKKAGTASPDLMLAKNFQYNNSESEGVCKDEIARAEFFAYVEVKRPGTIKIIEENNQYMVKLNKHDEGELRTYLKHENGKKIIFTDGYKWVLFEGNLDIKEKFELYKNESWIHGEWGELHTCLEQFILDKR